MKLNLESMIPIYIQIAEGIEDDIVNSILTEGERAYSQYQVANEYNINPATAAKGIKLLEEEGILFKKRGLGMYVNRGAKDVIIKKRRDKFISQTLVDVVLKAKQLGLSRDELLKIMEKVGDE